MFNPNYLSNEYLKLLLALCILVETPYNIFNKNIKIKSLNNFEIYHCKIILVIIYKNARLKVVNYTVLDYVF